ncbi:hypothetical protein RvY_04946 [Ramazzottius varieornatus]|uniref:Uncharacterized protein n=1 Tax=Ramazzottius varieornatus TaxID=947166 RepID=A0A1D1UWW9_RAMVA|nr:hypothetical protein RvY_04946 [Ramazzottius varieornatus]
MKRRRSRNRSFRLSSWTIPAGRQVGAEATRRDYTWTTPFVLPNGEQET